MVTFVWQHATDAQKIKLLAYSTDTYCVLWVRTLLGRMLMRVCLTVMIACYSYLLLVYT